MQPNILFITSRYLRGVLTDLLDELSVCFPYQIAEYESFHQMTLIYAEYVDWADGIVVSGRAAQMAIEKSVGQPEVPIVSFEVGISRNYFTLLEECVFRRNVEPERIIIDYLTPYFDDPSLRFFVESGGAEGVGRRIMQGLRESSVDDLCRMENDIAQRIIDLWEQGRADLVICQYGSIIPRLEEKEIPYRYPMCSAAELNAMLEELLSMIDLANMRQNLPAVIGVGPRSAEDVTPEKLEMVYRALMEFKRENLADFLPQKQRHGCDLFTSLQTVNRLTHRAQDCQLSCFLEERLPFSVAVGYGVGGDVNQAKARADSARREAALQKGSFLIDEHGNLIGPLNSTRCLTVSSQIGRDVADVAERCRLSPMTVQKLDSILRLSKSNRVTTHELAERAGMTIRNANRILRHLEEGGAASVVCTQAPNSKGRPMKVYELHLE